MAVESPAILRLALPKGRMQNSIFTLLRDAGIRVEEAARGYRPRLGLPGADVKLLKPRNVLEMLQAGSRDLGFAGADWVEEMALDGQVVEVMDTGLDPVRLVAAAPVAFVEAGWPPPNPKGRALRVASEYERLTRCWMNRLDAKTRFIRSFGATEVFPPEDADCVVDNTASGETLRSNGLVVVDELLRSTTRLYASSLAMEDPDRRARVEQVALLLRSVLDARLRVMLELNVPEARLEAVVDVLPSMRRATVSRLHGEEGYAVKAAVPRAQLPNLIPLLKRRGGQDIVVSTLAQIVS